jgi:3-oxoacyl-[acyl-carrier-protein] synthase II
METKRVVVTGIGAITPIGNSVPEMWQAMKEGKSGVGPITLFDATNFKTQFAAEVKDFDITTIMDRKEARKLDRYAQLAIAAAKEAMEHSRLNMQEEDADRIGVIWGTGMGGLTTLLGEHVDFVQGDGTPRFGPFYPQIDSQHGFGTYLVALRSERSELLGIRRVCLVGQCDRCCPRRDSSGAR